MFEYNGSRIAFSLFGVDVYWYGLLIVIGMIVAVLLSANEFKRRGYDPEIIYDIALWILPAAVIGARLWYVLFELDKYDSILEMINVRDGGLAIQGGIIFAVFIGYIYSKVKKLNLVKITDVIMIFLPLGQAIGRWGNFVNNEAHGAETNLPWAVIIDGVSYHPTFFYESMSNFIIMIILWLIYRSDKYNTGTVSSLYLIFYGIIRFFIEGLRTDSLYLGSFRVAQLISIVFVMIGLCILFLSKKGKFESKDINIM